eukprot:CAMPEP_0201622148 /NCGR_PEP_ID=MMETSP0492-20130828/47255_1 /ASSEMBLY_ACC=CAM_ASM_000837 /TAXON_ID=420259 /ORGANISM="Thalassiosira gravida, Strain GMp14c1" /LENGTH=197 /DNA_ID=CAMNT_0048091727 /DNA_START=105 /DNA_END=699 /DNA_ORIENTATION=-
MVVFIQPKCIKYQTEHPDHSLWACYFYVIFSEQIKFGQRFIGVTRTDAIDFDDGIGFETYNHRLSECPDDDDEDENTPPEEPKNGGVKLSLFVNANADTPPAEPDQAPEVGVVNAAATTDHYTIIRKLVMGKVVMTPLSLFVSDNADTPPAEPDQAPEVGVVNAAAATDHQHHHSQVSDGEISHDTSYSRFLEFNKK